MPSGQPDGRPSSRKLTFRKMLDLEKKHKLDRLQAQGPSTFTAMVPARSPGIPSAEDPMALQSKSRPVTITMMSNSLPPAHQPSLNQATQLQQTLAVKRAGAGASLAPPLRIEVPQRDNGHDSDKSSICQSPGWDNSKAKQKKQEAKERKKREKEEAVRAAKETKRPPKRISKAPPTNRVFNWMNSTPMERSTSTPALDTVAEENPSQDTVTRQPSSRRGSLEAGLRTLKNIAGPWKHDKHEDTRPQLEGVPGGFVGGLKLKMERENVTPTEIQRFSFSKGNQTQSPVERPVSHSRTTPEGGLPVSQHAQFDNRMPPPQSDSESDQEGRNSSRMGKSEASYAARRVKYPHIEPPDPAPIMEMKIKRPVKNTKINTEEISKTVGTGRPLPYKDRTVLEVKYQPSWTEGADVISVRKLYKNSPTTSPVIPPLRKSTPIDLDAEDGSRGKKSSPFTESEQLQRNRGQSAQQMYDRRTSTMVFGSERTVDKSHWRHRSLPFQPMETVEPSNDEDTGGDETSTSFDKTRDNYHNFHSEGQTESPIEINPSNPAQAGKPEKVLSSSSSFRSLKNVAKAAFSRSPTPPVPAIITNPEATGSSWSLTRPTTASTVGESYNRKSNKAERLLGEPSASSVVSSRTSDHSSSQSSEEVSIFDETSSLSTPTISRPQSQKDDSSSSRESSKAAPATSMRSDRKSAEDGHSRSSSHDAWGRTAVPLKRAEYQDRRKTALETRSAREPQYHSVENERNSAFANSSPQEPDLEDTLPPRRSSVTKSRSTPELQDLSFLPPLKHQALERSAKGKGKGKEKDKERERERERQKGEPTKYTTQHAIQRSQDSELQALIPSPSSPQPPSPTKGAGAEYLQNARLNVLRAGQPASKPGRVPSPTGVMGPTPTVEPIAKMFVVCCSCHYFHDMPSKIYECMAKPDNIVEDRDLGVSGHITTMVRCPWCSHGMSTTCCAGYAAVVYMQEKLH